MEQSSKQTCIVLRIVSILSPTNNLLLYNRGMCACIRERMCPLMLCIYSHREEDPNTSQVSQLLFNSDRLFWLSVCVCVRVCACVSESLSPAGSESMRLCIGSPHSWCMLATNIWILVPRVPLLIRGWRGVEGSGGDSSPVSMNLPVSHHRALCCSTHVHFVHTCLGSEHINNSGFDAKHDRGCFL